jgi:hypothetical protein
MLQEQKIFKHKPAFPFRLNQQSQQSAGLIGWWPMSPGELKKVYDFSGRGGTGTLVDFADPIDAFRFDPVHGHYLFFDSDFGNEDYITIPHSESCSPKEEFTISFWFRTEEGSNTVQLFHKQQLFPLRGINIIKISGTSRIQATISTPTGSDTVQGTTSVNGDGWHHIAVTRDADVHTIWLDGVTEATSVSGFTGSVENQEDIRLGHLISHLDGDLTDIRIYNRALTSTEIFNLWQPETRFELYRETNTNSGFNLSFLDPSTQFVGGGAVAGGTAHVSVDQGVGGGVLVSGLAKVTPFKEVPEGGAVCGGHASLRFTDVAVGGVLVGGVAEENFGDVVEFGGGILVGGVADVVLVSNPQVSGGVIVVSKYPNGFAYRRLLTVPSGEVSANIEKFYLSVSAGLDPVLPSSPTDFQFESLAGVRLYHYLRLYDVVTGRFVAVVKTPIPSDSDTEIYLYFGS